MSASEFRFPVPGGTLADNNGILNLTPIARFDGSKSTFRLREACLFRGRAHHRINMVTRRNEAAGIDEYIAAFSPEVQETGEDQGHNPEGRAAGDGNDQLSHAGLFARGPDAGLFRGVQEAHRVVSAGAR